MIWIDEKPADYTKAINALNFDKLGHENGLGSWGVLCSIANDVTGNMKVFIGLKMDVITVVSDRYTTSFVNIGADIKAKIEKLKGGSAVSRSITSRGVYNISNVDSSNIVTMYIDVHKIEIDIVEFANRIYDDKTHVEQYSQIAQTKVFKTNNTRAARAISASMQRVYSGNLENIGFIFTSSDEIFLLNELIIRDELVHDEIKYTIWLTPHDLEESKFLNSNGLIKFEGGSAFIDGLGSSKVIGKEATPMFVYDRRSFRNGYLDVTVKDPSVNFAYYDGKTEFHDTYFWSSQSIASEHKSVSMIGVSSAYYNSSYKILSSVVPDVEVGVLRKSQDDTIQTSLCKQVLPIETGSKYSIIDSLTDSLFIPTVESTFMTNGSLLDDSTKANLSTFIKETLLVPMVILNQVKDLTTINIDTIKDSVIFIYHPVLDKTVFFEVDRFDTSTIESNKIMFEIGKNFYGIEIGQEYGVFTWGNFKKKFRLTSSKWMSLTGEANVNGDIPSKRTKASDPVSALKMDTKSGIPLYDDLEINGAYAIVTAISKSDMRNIISKTKGTLDGEFIFGVKSGEVSIPRSSIWM